MNPSAILCPVCNQENEDDATICVNCGAELEETRTKRIALPENFGQGAAAEVESLKSAIDMEQIPEGGLGIYVEGAAEPYYLFTYKELILGRASESSLEAVLDLSEQDAANQGVSRRHAMIRRAGSGFNVIDLASRNGTWLNEERLVANRPYPLASGSQLRLGKLRLLVVYQSAPKDTEKN